MQTLRAMLVTLLVSLTGGCFLSGVPALQPADGEDIGRVLEFTINLGSRTDPEVLGTFRFVRVSGSLYETNIFGEQGARELYDDERGAALIHRLGNRNGVPVYLVQVRMGPATADGSQFMDYAISLVAVQEDGAGIQAVFDSQMPGLVDLAAEFGLAMTPFGGANYLWFLHAKSVKPDVLGFIEAARARGLVGWEDELGISLYEEFGKTF